MTAASYHRLLLYHRACGTAAHDADSNDKWFPAPYERYSSSCGKCRRDSNKGGIDEYRTACKAMFLRRPSPSTILDVGVPEKVAATWFERRSGMPCLHRPQYFQEFRSAYAAEVESLGDIKALPCTHLVAQAWYSLALVDFTSFLYISGR